MADTTTVSNTTPWPPVQEPLQNAINEAGRLYGGSVTYDPVTGQYGIQGGQTTYIPRTIAPQTAGQTAAGTSLYNQVLGNTGTGAASTDFLNSLLTGQKQITAPTTTAAQVGPTQSASGGTATAEKINFGYVPQLTEMVNGGQNNPYLAQMVAAAIQPVSENYRNTVIPTLNSGAQAAGRYGGSLNDLLTAKAASDYERNIGDISSNLYGTSFENAQNRALQAMGLGGQLATSQAQLGTQASISNAANATQASIANAANSLQNALAQAGFQQNTNQFNAMNNLNTQGANIANALNAVGQGQNADAAAARNAALLYNMGSANRDLTQAALDEATAGGRYAQTEPTNRLNTYINQLLNMGGRGSTTMSSSDVGYESPDTWSQILGGLTSLAGVGSLLNW